MIRRIAGSVPHRSRAVVHGGVIHAVATATDKSNSVYQQMVQCLAIIDDSLAMAGSNKSRVLTVVVYLADMTQKQDMNRAWEEWVEPPNAPMRACIGAQLAPGDLVELVVQAAE